MTFLFIPPLFCIIGYKSAQDVRSFRMLQPFFLSLALSVDDYDTDKHVAIGYLFAGLH